MANDGWFILSRKEDELYFDEKFTRWQAWQDLIRIACFKPYSTHLRGIMIEHKVGCVYESQDSLARRWQWSRGKVDRFLKELEMDERIAQQKSNVVTCISITNYERYQFNGATNETADSAPNRTPNSAPNESTLKEVETSKNNNTSSTTRGPEKKFVKTEDIAVWLNNAPQGWKDACAMNLGITPGQLATEFLKFQNELIIQGVTEKSEEDILRHFANQTRARRRAEKKDAPTKATNAKSDTYGKNIGEKDFSKGFDVI